MSLFPELIDGFSHLSAVLADYSQPTINEADTRPIANRAFIIIGAFVVIPVAIAWFMSKCAAIYEARHPEEA